MGNYRLGVLDPREQEKLHPDDRGKYLHYGAAGFMVILAKALDVVVHGGKVTITSVDFMRKYPEITNMR